MSRHGQNPTPRRREGLLMIAAQVSAVLALAVAWVLPIQFSDAHHASVARTIAASGDEPYPLLNVRQKVGHHQHGGFTVDAEVADYWTLEGGTATVALHGYDQSAVVAEQEGWFAIPGSSGGEVYVTGDGQFGMLAADYRSALGGEFDDLYRVADAWVAGWLLVGLGALIGRSAGQVRRGAASVWRAGLTPVLYIAVAVALLAIAYGLSLPLASGS
jgi:hypothetical protein